MSQSSTEAKGRRGYLWIEISVVLLVCVAPWLFGSVADVYLIHELPRYTFLYHALSTIVRSAGATALVLFVIWRSGDSPARFGLGRFSVFSQLSAGVGIWVIEYIVVNMVWLGLYEVLNRLSYLHLVRQHFPMRYSLPSSGGEYFLLGVMCLANGLAEELVMRAYLITRLEELLSSTIWALLLTTAIFAVYHAYQGIAGVISAAIFGLIQGIAFCKLRRLAPIAFAHALQDFIALLPRAW